MTAIRTIPTARNRLWSILALVVAGVIAACGGPAASNGAADDQASAGNGSDGTGNGSNDNGGTSGGSADGPITVSMADGTYAYSAGRCEIIDDAVYVIAVAQDQRGGFEATLPPWDREMAYAQREGFVSMTNFGEGSDGAFELVAGRGSPGTTWEWTVSGSDVEIEARMANRTNATRDQGIEEFTDYRDVTIQIDCSGGAFGSGPNTEIYAEHDFFPLQDPMQRVPGTVTVELDGTTYEITYLTTCQFFQDEVSAEGIANEANGWLYSEGRGVHLDFAIGDRRDQTGGVDVERWGLPPDVQLQDDFLFEGSDVVRSWSGTVLSSGGEEAEATITVECTEGDAFQSAGSGSIVLDGVTHVLDVVNTCSIDGTTVDFYGNASATDVTVIVTAGGSQILLGDEDGQQSLTRDVEFEVAGQQATWSGLLAGDRQATVEISCG